MQQTARILWLKIVSGPDEDNDEDVQMGPVSISELVHIRFLMPLLLFTLTFTGNNKSYYTFIM